MDSQLRTAFAEFGEVVSASVVLDRVNGQSRGFGFVEFSSQGDAEKAIQALDGTELDGRSINVSIARPREGGGGGGGGRGNSRGGGGGGGGGFDRRGGGGGRDRRW